MPSSPRQCAHSSTSAAKSAKRLYDDPGELFEGRQPRRDLRQAIIPEHLHPGLERRPLDVLAACVLGGETAQILRHDHELVDADTAFVASLVAPWTASLAIEADTVCRSGLIGREASVEHLLPGDHVHLGAVRAELADEPLSENGRDRGAREEGLDPHLVQTSERARSVVRMERRENEVAGEGGLDGDLGGLHVADLAD